MRMSQFAFRLIFTPKYTQLPLATEKQYYSVKIRLSKAELCGVIKMKKKLWLFLTVDQHL